jgi:hypothetical protein
MTKSYSLLVLISFMLLSSCGKDETFKYYSFDIYPIKDINNSGTWIETDFLSNEKLSFQINSLRILEEYHDFEALDIPICRFYSDKDLIINSDTVRAGENLLKKINDDMISFKQHIGEYGKEYSWYYLIIKSTAHSKLNISNGYYQFNFEGKTVNGYEINDSLIVKYNNR